MRFSLTLKQLERLLEEAKSHEQRDDILHFEVKSYRLKVTQDDWSHDKASVLMDKPC